MQITRHWQIRKKRIHDKNSNAVLRRIVSWVKCYQSLRDWKIYVKFFDSNKHEKVAILAKDVLVTILDWGMFNIYTRVRHQLKEIEYTENIKQII
jgi:hypothetical protein